MTHLLRAPELAVLVPGLALALLCLLRPPGPSSWLGLPSSRLRRLLGAALLVGLAWHTATLLVYWQMLPAWAAAVLLLPTCIRRGAPGPGPWARTTGAAAALLLLLSAASLAVLPLFQLPRPTGLLPVGTTILHIVDPGRLDASFASGHRELMVQLWYPAATPPTGSLARYRRWRETTLLSSYQAVLPTHAHVNTPVAPVAKNGPAYPVLLFNPAWEGMRTQNTFLVEDLASHGFVVVGIDHPHNSMLVAFPDGQVVRPTGGQAVDDFHNRSIQQVLAFADGELATEVADDRLVLDELARLAADPASPWYHALDPNRAGALGHSFGGAVAVAACGEDPRIRAALNMDGWMFGALDRPLGKPLFLIYDGDWPFNPAVIARERRSAETGDRLDIRDLDATLRSMDGAGGYFLAMEQTRHMNFTDRALYSPIHALTDTGEADAAEVHRILREYTLAFFAQILHGEASPLLGKGAVYPGTYFEKVPGSDGQQGQP